MSNIELIDTSSKRTLTDSLTEHLQTPYFKVEQFGFLVLTTSEQYPDTWYPTPKDIYPGGWFTIEMDNGIAGDFNGDGLQDLVIHPMMFPHVVPRNTTIEPLFLLQNPDGTFQSPSIAIEGANFPDKFMLYRFGAADFNGDGITDVAMSTMNRPLNVRTGNEEVTTTAETPLVVYGNQSTFTWTDTYKNLTTEADQTGYNAGHSMTAGDFNGDGLSDWFSAGYVAYSNGESLTAERLVANANAASGTNGWIGEWFWWNVNACAAADFNEDGFSDLVYSCMPAVDDGTYNGGDLYVVLGSNQGLNDGLDVIQVDRTNDSNRNVGTNFIVAADFNGDGHQDLILLEHGWVSDTGDSTKYYSEGKFRLFVGNGSGEFSEDTTSVIDPYAGHRSGEGNLFAMDANGDGWIDLVSTGYLVKSEDSWNSSSTKDSTCIFINDHGVLKLVPTTDMAYVQPYQFEGEEINKDFLQIGTQRMYPVDLGGDGLIDFVGFVGTPLHAWPQVEQIYTYAYVSRGIAPLGRITGNETLVGTLSTDKIFGYEGDDVLIGKAGNDILNGGSGLDKAIFSGRFMEYSINAQAGLVTDLLANRDGNDTLSNVERLHFSDTKVALDITGTAGEAYRIYKAAFDRAPDTGGLGFWINAMDHGSSLTSVAAGFINSPEFQKLYGADVSDRDYVTKLYNNVLDRNPDQGGYDFWLGALAKGSTREDILVNFSESKENIANVADLIANGIQYQEWVG